ncbi:TPA: sugar ABC transporter ATP-binding protein, partial [Klebsiella pneumoniae]|nr:sugar ABC transporter ATP-binding protein [Klebsiella pneumoniae]HBX0670119.1 sugar ABC transporter ATP-binding protein [Klebsiella pneumoniae]
MHPVINFSHVTKEYPLYHHIGSGIKDLIFHPKRAFQLLKGRKYLAIEDVSFTVGKG